MTRIYAVNISKEMNLEEFNKLLVYVSEEKNKILEKKIRYEDKMRTLVGELLARYGICRWLHIKNNQIIFCKNKYGKPYLKNYKNCHFNISHSGVWVVCAISDVPIGIDIEMIKDTNLEIAKRFFTLDEYNDLMMRDNSERIEYFYELWTLKEAYIKAIGKGLSISLNSFYVNNNCKKITVTSRNSSKNYLFEKYYLDDNYKLSICYEHTID